MKQKIAVGMSGGIDSSVAAALLVEQGYDVVGLTAHMWSEGSRCCSEEDVKRARKVAWHLDIRHVVLNATDVFRERVVDPFVREYARARTPSPCVLCNEAVKFGFLLHRAVQFGCIGLATGHYARVERVEGCCRLLKAADTGKDQSYFLHRLSQRQLAHAFFPLGEWAKQDVVRYAEERALPVVRTQESQDLCFVRDGEYARFVEDRVPRIRREGRIVDADGNTVGQHAGLHHFTVGQRRGLGVAVGRPVYVERLNREANEVLVGARQALLKNGCRVEDVSWISDAPPADPGDVHIRIRYRHREAVARIRPIGASRVHVDFRNPQFAVTPGQAAVFYRGNEVLGGGWIASPESAPSGEEAEDAS